MTEQATTDRANELLEGMRTSLAADGYGIEIEGIDEGLRLTVSANDGICSDCLVPVDMFRGIVSTMFEKGGLEVGRIEIQYPEDAAH